MAESDQDILIRILTAYEGGGIDAAKKAVSDLSVEGGRSAEKTKGLNEVLDLLDKRGQNGAEAIRGLLSVMKGGPDSIGAVSNGISKLAGMLGGGGLLMIAIAAAGNAIGNLYQLWVEKNEEAAAAAKQASEEQVKAVEDAKKALEDLNKAKVESVKENVRQIAAGLTEAASKAKELRDALSTLENANLELEFARIDQAVAMGLMSKEDAAFAKASRKVETERGQLQRELAGEQAFVGAQSDAINEARSKATAAQLAAEEALAKAESASSSRKSADEKAAEAERIYGQSIMEDHQKIVRKAKEDAAAAAEAESQAKGDADRASIASAGASGAVDQAMQNARAEIEKANQRIAVLETRIATQNVLLTNTTIGKTSAAAQASAEKKAGADSAEARRQKDEADAAASAEANMPPEERLARAVRLGVGPGQRVGGQLYVGAAAGDTQQKARAAIGEAGQKIMAGADDAKVVEDLVETLRALGAVIPNWARLRTELDALDGKIELVRSQTKNNRG